MDIEIELLPHQKKVFESQTRVTGMSCGIGAGKSYTAALLAIMELMKNNRVLMISGTGAMIRDVLIWQMKQILAQMNLKYKYNQNTNLFTIEGSQGSLFLKTEKSKETINGLTQINTVIIDECRLVSEAAYTYAISRQRKIPRARVYLFGTGTTRSSWFAKRCMQPTTTWVQASIYDNEKYNGKEYIESVIQEYADLPEEFRQRELYGAFTDGDESSLFSNVKYLEEDQYIDGPTYAGLDVAGTGNDYSAISVIQGNRLIYLTKKKTMDIDVLTDWVGQVNKMYKIDKWRHDSTGIGNLLKFPNSIPLNFGGSGGTRFHNARSMIYFQLRDKLSRGIIIGNQAKRLYDTEAIPELLSTKLSPKEKAKLLLISKDEIKKLIGRSPDVADSLALAAIPAYDIVNHGELRMIQVQEARKLVDQNVHFK